MRYMDNHYVKYDPDYLDSGKLFEILSIPDTGDSKFDDMLKISLIVHRLNLSFLGNDDEFEIEELLSPSASDVTVENTQPLDESVSQQ